MQVNNESEFGQLLDKHDLKKTKARIGVLEILNSRETAVSQPLLEDVLGKEVDRVTLYRVLKTFEEKGIIHKIIDLNGTANYAICGTACKESKHHDEHLHFNCTVCYGVYCLDSFKVPKVIIPEGFTAGSINVIMYGICDGCNKKTAGFKATL